MSYHNCQSSLCVSPHYENDEHEEFCLCQSCHPEHEWQEWNCYPSDCEGCLRALAQWLHENTDYVGCIEPDLCRYDDYCKSGMGRRGLWY